MSFQIHVIQNIRGQVSIGIPGRFLLDFKLKKMYHIENNKEQEVLEKFKEEFSNELTLLKLR